jgi:hypothetical protein
MKESKPDVKLIEQIAEELAIDPSFVEKDWYATQIVRVIQTLDNLLRRRGLCSIEIGKDLPNIA